MFRVTVLVAERVAAVTVVALVDREVLPGVGVEAVEADQGPAVVREAVAVVPAAVVVVTADVVAATFSPLR